MVLLMKRNRHRDSFTQIKYMTDTNRMKIKLDTSSGIRKIFPFNFMSIKHASFKQSLAFFLLLGN